MSYENFRNAVQRVLPRQGAYNWWVGISALWCRYLDSGQDFSRWWYSTGRLLVPVHMRYART